MALAQIKLPRDLVREGQHHELECQGTTVAEALAHGIAVEPRLKTRIFREDGSVWVAILVNGQSVSQLDGMKTVLTDGDEIRLISPIPGG